MFSEVLAHKLPVFLGNQIRQCFIFKRVQNAWISYKIDWKYLFFQTKHQKLLVKLQFAFTEEHLVLTAALQWKCLHVKVLEETQTKLKLCDTKVWFPVTYGMINTWNWFGSHPNCPKATKVPFSRESVCSGKFHWCVVSAKCLVVVIET